MINVDDESERSHATRFAIVPCAFGADLSALRRLPIVGRSAYPFDYVFTTRG
jgi:hypothetical protein